MTISTEEEITVNELQPVNFQNCTIFDKKRKNSKKSFFKKISLKCSIKKKLKFYTVNEKKKFRFQ